MDIVIAAQYGGELTADALLVLKEEGKTGDAEAGSPSSKRQKRGEATDSSDDLSGLSMPAHRAVLWSLSEYFASKFRNWSSHDSKPEITVLVPPGQLEIGKALVTAMYTKLPDDLDQQQLLQLLTLAESYKIDKVSTAVTSTISSMRTELLQWETVLAIQQLPAAEPLFAPLRAAAEARKLQLLGDLELVWALENEIQRQFLQHRFQPGKRAAIQRAKAAASASAAQGPGWEQSDWHKTAVAAQEAAAAAAHNSVLPHTLLLQLPFAQLVDLLQCPKVKVASENAVHYTITRWLEHNPQTTAEQRKQLASLVRLPWCTPNYLINVVCSRSNDSSSWLLEHTPAADLAHALAGCVAMRHDSVSTMLKWDHQSASDSHMQCQRPLSVLAKLEMMWHIPLAALQGMYQGAIDAGYEDVGITQEAAFIWQGSRFQSKLNLWLGDSYVHAMWVEPVETTSRCPLDGCVTVYKAPNAAQEQPKVYLDQRIVAGEPWRPFIRPHSVFLMFDTVWHDDEEVQEHVKMDYTASDWPELEAKLQELGLVHSDGCLHIRTVIDGLC